MFFVKRVPLNYPDSDHVKAEKEMKRQQNPWLTFHYTDLGHDEILISWLNIIPIELGSKFIPYSMVSKKNNLVAIYPLEQNKNYYQCHLTVGPQTKT